MAVFGIKVVDLTKSSKGEVVYRTSSLHSAGEMYGKYVKQYDCKTFPTYPILAQKREKGHIMCQVSLEELREEETN